MARRRRRGRRKMAPKGWRAMAERVKKSHKPLKLLKMFHTKMERNVDKLGDLIARRQAAGER